MQQSMSAHRVAGVMESEHAVPARRWHAHGYQVSIFSSLLMAAVIGVFFYRAGRLESD